MNVYTNSPLNCNSSDHYQARRPERLSPYRARPAFGELVRESLLACGGRLAEAQPPCCGEFPRWTLTSGGRGR